MTKTRARTQLVDVTSRAHELDDAALEVVVGGRHPCPGGGGGGTQWTWTYPSDPDGLMEIDDE